MRKKFPLIIIGIAVVFLAIFFVKTASIYPFMFQLIFDRGVSLKQTDNNINILLLGIGGGSHDGPNLTDTIILATINKKNNKVVLTSIPRDLWVPDLTSSIKKVNEAYADGESKRKGGGLVEAEATVGKITGQNIDYGVRIDFSGFVKAVDIIGGLDVNVDNTFDDYTYPISGKENETCGNTPEDIKAYTESGTASAELDLAKFPCRYKYLHFDKGLTHMDGETALEFVRSRHAAQAIEASDFARSKRQEKIIKAFKDKVLSAQTLINPAKVLELYNVLSRSIDTDIKQSEFDDFIRLANQMKNVKIVSSVVDAGDEEVNRPGLLVNPPLTKEYGYTWVLIPRTGNGNFSEIQSYISCEINNSSCLISPTPKP